MRCTKIALEQLKDFLCRFEKPPEVQATELITVFPQLCFPLSTTASELILEWGRRGEARRAESRGWGSWGGDSQPIPTN